MTSKNQSDEIRRRMDETGESRAEARRKVMEARSRKRPGTGPEKVYVQYTFTRWGEVEVDAAEWRSALSFERRRMVEQAFAADLDADYEIYGAEGVAECVDNGELDFEVTTQAERDAAWDAEAIETGILEYAGIEDGDEWPAGVARPRDCFVVQHAGAAYVVLREQRRILAVFDVTNGEFLRLTKWPKEIERR